MTHLPHALKLKGEYSRYHGYSIVNEYIEDLIKTNECSCIIDFSIKSEGNNKKQGLSSIFSLFRNEFNILDAIDELTSIKLRILVRNAIL